MAISSRVKDKGDSRHTSERWAFGSKCGGTDGSGRGVRTGGVGTPVNGCMGIAVHGHVGLVSAEVMRRWLGQGDIDRGSERGRIGVVVGKIAREDRVRVCNGCISHSRDCGGGGHQYESLTVDHYGSLL